MCPITAGTALPSEFKYSRHLLDFLHQCLCLLTYFWIIQTLDTIHTSFPRTLTPYLNDFLTSSLNHLHALFPTFSHYYLLNAESAPSSSENDSIDLTQLICPILDFVSAVSRGGKARDWFDPGNLNNLIASVFGYTQMTEEDVSIGDVSIF